jgi:Zn-dependent peptidase ImmA (M78 family)/DNA-binding transcriptional regulator YiaG
MNSSDETERNNGDSEEKATAVRLHLHQREQALTATAVNTEALMIAREMSGWTQTEVARATGFSQARISRWEDGISAPSQEELDLLASKLKVPAKFFLRSDVKRSVFNSFYRKRKSVPQRTLMQFNSRVCFRQIQIDRLLSKVDWEIDPFPRFDPTAYKGGMKQVAASLRQLLKLPPGPIKNLIQPLEDVGVIIVLDDFGVTKIDGVSTFSNSGRPIIFLNTQAPNSRRRFSLAHEMAHTALHQYVAPDADEQADDLAAEFLMPEDEIRPELESEPITLARLANLKLRWRVAMAAILYRAKKLNILQQRRYTYLWMQMSSAGYKMREPYEELLAEEPPSLERDLVGFHRQDLEYSPGELAVALDMTEADARARYDIPASGNFKIMN